MIAASYLLGCFTSGYYLVRWRTGQDIRREGSRSAGATNVGRSLGRVGFLLTFFIDFAKGAFAVWMAVQFDLSPFAISLVLLAVILGHIYPIQLAFGGGKGIATSLGALLVFDWRAALILFALFLPFYGLFRRFTLSGLLAYALLPLAVYFFDRDLSKAACLSLLAGLILLAHRTNIREEIARMLVRRQEKAQPYNQNAS